MKMIFLRGNDTPLSPVEWELEGYLKNRIVTFGYGFEFHLILASGGTCKCRSMDMLYSTIGRDK